MVHIIQSVEEYNNIIATTPAVLVKYGARWCRPCKDVKPHVEAFQLKYPNIKIIDVDHDEFETIVQDENIQKLPTFKAFFNSELVGTQIGVKLDLLESLLIDLSNRLAPDAPLPTPQQEEPTATPQPIDQKDENETPKPPAPAAHPALAVQNDSNIMKGSSVFKHITSAPQQLLDFKADLNEYDMVVFSHSSQQPTTGVATPMKNGLSSNAVVQLLNDMKLLQSRFSNNNVALGIKHVIITDGDNNSDVLKYEFGLDKIVKAPIIKLFYKKIVFATIYNGNAYEVEAKLPEFIQL